MNKAALLGGLVQSGQETLAEKFIATLTREDQVGGYMRPDHVDAALIALLMPVSVGRASAS